MSSHPSMQSVRPVNPSVTTFRECVDNAVASPSAVDKKGRKEERRKEKKKERKKEKQSIFLKHFPVASSGQLASLDALVEREERPTEAKLLRRHEISVNLDAMAEPCIRHHSVLASLMQWHVASSSSPCSPVVTS